MSGWFLTMEDFGLRLATQQDSASFIDGLELPLLIDKVEYSPHFS